MKKGNCSRRVLARPGGPLGFWLVAMEENTKGDARPDALSNVKTTVGCALCCAPIRLSFTATLIHSGAS
jgi:hypothetical protein